MLRAGLRGKRLRLSDDDRRRLAVKAKALGREALAQIASVATSATILRWYRYLIAAKYDGSKNRSPGRPPTAKDIRETHCTRDAGEPDVGIYAPAAHSRTSNTDTKLLIYGLFQKGRVLAQDGSTSSTIITRGIIKARRILLLFPASDPLLLSERKVSSRERLGGLLRFYHRESA